MLEAASAIEAIDLLAHNVQQAQQLVSRLLIDDGWNAIEVDKVVQGWILQGDYLLRSRSSESADFVVGNPPYIRLEDVPEVRMAAYRRSCNTMGGRADIYVGFYEKGLVSLKSDGKLAFICADRWMRNQYGRGLRQLIARQYSMDLALIMHDVDAFEDQVSAYPAITVISNRTQGTAIAADTRRSFSSAQAHEFASWTTSSNDQYVDTETYHAARLPHWFAGDDSWPSASPARLAMLEELSQRYQLLEDRRTGTRVGIGVATGADKIFITDRADLVETDRLLPLSMVRDTKTGIFEWNGSYLVNPWDSAGNLVDLTNYPRLASYFKRHASVLRKRHIAIKQPSRWYKTIDKVDPHLTAQPKLLLPDMKMTIHPVLDEGGYYPHHNLYFIVSDSWDLRVLGGLMLSKVAEAFVEAYAVKMRGGTLRFQAQYLRKIRVPNQDDIDESTCNALREAFEKRDSSAATEAALRAYGLDHLPD
ncbi:type II DNA modification methyltransferase [Sinosporangium siamense]|uniref:site-specific DNA-methyltransferase (adenine-specific) n=1 Tax=Sinosporangium siamense TaxID=1367973 RepID=A0A919V5N9_9ACTN|nr:type II DNA modification methyltransferase [Sinosporangium siamense]